MFLFECLSAFIFVQFSETIPGTYFTNDFSLIIQIQSDLFCVYSIPGHHISTNYILDAIVLL